MGKYDDVLVKSELSDTAWISAQYFSRKVVYNEVQHGPMSSSWDDNDNSSSAVEDIILIDTNNQVNNQNIPVWAAYKRI